MRRVLVGIQVLVILVALGLAPAGRIESAAGRPGQPAAGAQIERLVRAGYLGGNATAVAVQGNYAYAGLGYELAVLNVADPARPRRVGSLLLPGVVRQIAPSGSIAYIADHDAGLRVISLAKPAASVEVGALALPGHARDVVVVGRYAYIAAGEGGLRIVDVANPSAPAEVGSYRIPSGNSTRAGEAEQVAVSGNYAYIAAGASGLQIVNIANPAAPVEIYGDPLVPMPTLESVAVRVAGHYTYIGDIVDESSYSVGHLRIMDIANPAQPVKVGDYNASGGGFDVDLAIAGQYAYLSTSSVSKYTSCAPRTGYLDVVDIRNPASPTLIGVPNGVTATQGMTIAGHYLYLATGDAGMQIVDVSQPTSLVSAGVYVPVSAGVLASAGQYVYVTGAEDLRVVDVADPSAPVVVGSHSFELGYYNCYRFISDIVVSDKYAYLTITDSGLHILNVSQPTLPRATGFLTITNAMQIAVAGGYASIVNGSGGLHIVDITHPSAPAEVSSLVIQAGSATLEAFSVAAAGQYVYVGTNLGWDGGSYIPPRLHIIDVADPAHPREIGSQDMPAMVLDIAVAGNYAYLATTHTGLRIVDISNPTAPAEVGAIDTDDWATSVAVDGTYAYVADRDTGLIAIDITNPVAPAKIDVYNTPSNSTAVAAANGIIYTNNGGGLTILRLLNLPHQAYLPLVDR